MWYDSGYSTVLHTLSLLNSLDRGICGSPALPQIVM